MNCTFEISFTIEMFNMKNDNDFRSILFFFKVENIKLLTHDGRNMPHDDGRNMPHNDGRTPKENALIFLQ